MDLLQDLLDDSFAAVRTAVSKLSPGPELRDVGTLAGVSGGIARVHGLPGIGSEELIAFPGGVLGLAVNLDPDGIGVILLGPGDDLTPGMRVHATARQADTPVGEGLIGRVIDATGRPLDGEGPLRVAERRPLETGIKAVDAMIPIGRSQRELIVGDRQTGKTPVALNTIINQRDKDVLCIYCAVGRRGPAGAPVHHPLRRHHHGRVLHGAGPRRAGGLR
jgi:F-type H+-transporting ATPase subunit alpha